MTIFTHTLGGDTVSITAPLSGQMDAASFRERFPSDGLYGLDVEGLYMDDRGQHSKDFGLRLIQFATTDQAWVLDLADPEQVRAAVALLSDTSVSFCSHTNMDVMSVATRLGVDITMRNVDTRCLASMAYPEKFADRSLKALTTDLIGPELQAGEATLHDKFKEIWPGRRNATRSLIDAHGWANIPVDDESYLVYAGLDAIACRRLAEILTPLTRAPASLIETETWLAGQANRIQLRGMLLDQEMLTTLESEATEATSSAKAAIAEITGGISPQSPKIQEWLGEHGVDWDSWEGACTDKGNPSLAKENVRLLNDHPLDDQGKIVVEHLIEFKSHLDILNKTKGVRKYLCEDGRLHPSLNTLGASTTARMSASNPNFQNFSKKDPRMRGLFLPEPGHILATIDFDQVELRVVAALARETKMIDTILAGGNLHQLTADELGISKSLAKMTNFLIVYGGGAKALHEQSGIPLDEAKQIVSSFRERYPDINEFSRRLGVEMESVRTISHRRLPVGTTKSGDSRSYANINYVVQSSARDLLVGAWRRFAIEFGCEEFVWFPIHDELVLHIPIDRADEIMELAEKCMRFDFMGVPISATAVKLIDHDGTSRWMTSDRAESIAKEKVA